MNKFLLHASSVLEPAGYEVETKRMRKYQGSDEIDKTVAKRDGVLYYCAEDPGWYQRLLEVQSSIPHMAPIAEIIHGVTLVEEVKGDLLWHIDDAANFEPMITCSLLEFATALRGHGFIHGDLRPWNVFVLSDRKAIKVIDWNCGWPVDELDKRPDLTNADGHYTRFGGGQNPEHLDELDARRIGGLLRGEVSYTSAWPQHPPHPRPAWCKV